MTSEKEILSIDILSKPVRYLKGVGPKRADLLAKLGILTVDDLLHHFPREYQDRTKITLIRELLAQEFVTINGTVQSIQEIRPFRRRRSIRHILKVTIVDGTGIIHAVWFNQPYRAKLFQEGKNIILSGKTRFNSSQLEIDPVEFEIFDDSILGESKSMGIVPIYPLSDGIEQRFLRNLILQVFEQFKIEIPEMLSKSLLEKYHFPNRGDALRQIHLPDSLPQIDTIRNRFVYEEFLSIQLALAIEWEKRVRIEKPQRYTNNKGLLDSFIKSLPFKLTSAQTRVFQEISSDLDKSSPMNRLLQGDVGSGKTMVALLAMLKAVENGYQSVLMVPTEVLADQHLQTFEKFLTPLNIPICLLTGSTKSKIRKEVLSKISDGSAKIIIGTHALLENPVDFSNLALAVIDEQHRFGVSQRNQLQKKGFKPDILIMTATPIPRTLSMTVYGDLDVSILDEMPPGRGTIITKSHSESDRNSVYSFLKEQVQSGRQVYFIYPLVEESDKMELRAAVQMYDHLKQDIFPECRLGLIHGRMSRAEQHPIMTAFTKGDLDILVSTTVIEVGIDVPNATVMVIEHAERFGLSQLHQLRGRVGRGKYQSYCLLITPENVSSLVQQRIETLTQTIDGFKIAEQDLRLRGPGEVLGTMQHGLDTLRIADLVRDKQWLIVARNDAFALIHQDPQLSSPQNKWLKIFLKKQIGQNQHYATVA